jgi:ABC-type nitrate/sulfonate/bicarbonate transport system substrate-binding protein
MSRTDLVSRRGTRTAAALAAVVAVGSCLAATASAKVDRTGGAHAAKLDNITIVVGSSAASSILPAFAQQAGIFRKYGIDAKVQVLSSALALSQLATGNAQFGDFGAPQPEEAREAGSDVRWIASWVSRSNLQLVAAPGIKSVKDLAGKAIGISTSGSVTDIMSHWIVQQAGLPVTSVKYVPLQSSSGIIAGFVGGNVDALLLSPPSSTNGLNGRPGSSIILDTNQKAYTYPFNGLAGYMPWVRKNKDLTIRVCKAMLDALRQFPKQKAAAEQAILSASPGTSQADLDAAYESAKSVFGTSIIPNEKIEKIVLGMLRDYYPGQYPNAVPKNSPQFLNQSYAIAATKALTPKKPVKKHPKKKK